jgi:hypothetical protein
MKLFLFKNFKIKSVLLIKNDIKELIFILKKFD